MKGDQTDSGIKRFLPFFLEMDGLGLATLTRKAVAMPVGEPTIATVVEEPKSSALQT